MSIPWQRARSNLPPPENRPVHTQCGWCIFAAAATASVLAVVLAGKCLPPWVRVHVEIIINSVEKMCRGRRKEGTRIIHPRLFLIFLYRLLCLLGALLLQMLRTVLLPGGWRFNAQLPPLLLLMLPLTGRSRTFGIDTPGYGSWWAWWTSWVFVSDGALHPFLSDSCRTRRSHWIEAMVCGTGGRKMPSKKNVSSKYAPLISHKQITAKHWNIKQIKLAHS